MWNLKRLSKGGRRGRFLISSALIVGLLLSFFFRLHSGVNARVTTSDDDDDFTQGDNADVQSCRTAIGIDLGTTYSCVAIHRDGKVDIIANEQGERTTPSQVAFVTKDQTIVGSACDSLKIMSPESVVYSAKRFIGRDYNSPEVQKIKKLFKFGLLEHEGKLKVKVKTSSTGETHIVVPELVSAEVLRKMKSIAEAYLGEQVCAAVITVPAYFNNSHRELTKDAAKIAGIKVSRIINEPTAAAIAYGLNTKSTPGKVSRILVYDLGGGTFDVSILEIQDGMFEVKATGGDTQLGGQDFDERLYDHVLKQWSLKHNNNVVVKREQLTPRSHASLTAEVEKAKRALSTNYEAEIAVPGFHNGKDLLEKVTRATFEHVNADLFNKTIDVVNEVMKQKDYSIHDIDDIVLVGGSTRIPRIVKLVTDKFGKDPRKNINPDEAVAYGAAVQAAILSGSKDSDVDQLLLLDVTSLTLGIEVQGGMIAPIIQRGTPIPISKSQVFTTVVDGQSTVVIKVYEGERPMAKNNFELGKFELTGIPPSPRGIPQIEVSFMINADGILKVTALDKGTGNKHTTVVRNDSRRLSQEQIDTLIKESEENATKDKQIKELAMAKNEMDTYLYNTKVLIKTAETKKISPDKVSNLKKLLEEVEAWYAKNSEKLTLDEVNEKIANMRDASMELAQSLYAASDNAPPTPPPSEFQGSTAEDLSGSDI